MVCPYCSAYIQDPGAIFCENCGSRLDRQQGGAAPSPQQAAPQSQTITNPYAQPQLQKQPVRTVGRKKKNNTLAVCICAVVAVAIMCGTAVTVTVMLNRKEDTSSVKQGSTQATQEEAVAAYEDDYILPTHNTYITFDMLSGYSKEEVDLICNEMYARHGQIFKKKKNQQYFEQQSWYEGKYTSMDYVKTLFNKYENANLDTIVKYRKHMGWS